MRRRVTFSRNLTLSLSRTCRCHCKYCSFATHKAHLYSPDEVTAILDGAVGRRVKELLVLTGEQPEVNREVAARLESYGHADFTGYVIWACQQALDRGLLPHTNIGAIGAGDLARLREVTASQGLMLESIRPDLVAHQGSPSKHPDVRLETIEAADVRVDTDQRRVFVRGEEVHLRRKEFELLRLLVDNAGRVLTRDVLIDRVWGTDYIGDTKTLDVHIKRLRSRIEANPSAPTLITTVRGVGYRFDAGHG